MMYRSIILISLIMVISGSVLWSQTDRMPFQINKLADQFVNNKSNKGLVIGVLHQDHQVLKGYGALSSKNPSIPDGNVLFDLGAISEVFTTSLMVTEALEGKFDIAHRVLEYLPEGTTMPSFDPMACEYVSESDLDDATQDRIFRCEISPFTPDKCITFCDLATHSSGLKNIPIGTYSWNPFKYLNQRKDPFKTLTKEDVYESLAYYQLNYEPGKIYSHSSWGIAVLGHLLADINAMTYEQLLNEQILMPLGMSNTFINIPSDIKSNYAIGHNRKGDPVAAMHFNGMSPALGIKSCGTDMMKFLEAQVDMHREPVDLRDAFVTTHDARLNTRKHHLGKAISLGYGWFTSNLSNDNDSAVIWIHGGTSGFNAFIGFIKSSQTGVVILSNSQNPTDKLGFKILEILNPDPIIF